MAFGANLGSDDPYWSLHAPYYFDFPAAAALSVLAAVLFVSLAPHVGGLRRAAGAVGAIVGVLGLIALPAYLVFYTGGI